ncbi:hypothetical protein [Streptomyces violens]|uniref:hypothetical protein n=1 Tax=Streptomyces violens TaxID=66377 RepID=UPI0012FEB684|nr:hypothetical protein [Streptomyces violens]
MTLGILAGFGVLSIFVFALRGFIDQLPELFASIRRALDAWRELWSARPDETEPVSHHQDHEPPAAA